MPASLQTETLDYLDEACAGAFDREACEDEPCPSLRELRALAVATPGASVRVPAARDGDELVALAACVVEPRRISGFPVKAYVLWGRSIYDYGRLYYGSEAALAALLAEIRADARRQDADVIFFEDLLADECVPGPLEGIVSRHTTRVFTAEREENGWDAILSRKSLRRHRNKAMKLYRYEVSHVRGDLTASSLEEMARLHRERWAFDGIESAFEDPARCVQFACHPANKHLTTIREDGEILACHFGMAYGETMVWHTPVVNVKYLDVSPLEVLLWEVADYCSANGFAKLDFGIGDESYKQRFANAERVLHQVCLPVTPRGAAVLGVRRVVNPADVLTRLKALKRRAWRVKIALRGRVNRVDCYDRAPDLCGEISVESRDLLVAERYSDYVDVCRRYGAPLERGLAERYRDGAFYVALHNGQEVVSSGWGTRARRFYIEELDRWVDPGGALMLFDFHTPPEHQRRGHYTRLLRSLLAKYAGETCCIFALHRNVPSIKAIEKAGFHPRAVWSEAPEHAPHTDKQEGRDG